MLRVKFRHIHTADQAAIGIYRCGSAGTHDAFVVVPCKYIHAFQCLQDLRVECPSDIFSGRIVDYAAGIVRNDQTGIFYGAELIGYGHNIICI